MRDRPVILCDVDGVLADFVGAVLRGTGVRREEITQFDLFHDLKHRGVDVGAIKATMADTDWWASLDVLEGAQTFVANLERHGEVVFCTSPWVACRQWEHARRTWISDHFGRGARSVITTSRKELVTGYALIDDKPENIEAWERVQGRQGYLYGAAYNEGTHTYESILGSLAKRRGA